MNTAGREKKEKVQTVPGCSCYPGVRRLPDGYEFALEVPRGSEASLVIYGKEGEKMEIPLPEASREGEVLSVKIKGIREEIKYNYQIDGEVIQDPRARYLQCTGVWRRSFRRSVLRMENRPLCMDEKEGGTQIPGGLCIV